MLHLSVYRLATAARAFFLGREPGKFDVPLFPRFFARLSLRAADDTATLCRTGPAGHPPQPRIFSAGSYLAQPELERRAWLEAT